jgi:hypothetical protein
MTMKTIPAAAGILTEIIRPIASYFTDCCSISFTYFLYNLSYQALWPVSIKINLEL